MRPEGGGNLVPLAMEGQAHLGLGPPLLQIHGNRRPLPRELQRSSLADLLERMLQPNPEQRVTLEEVRQHPWVVESGVSPQQMSSSTPTHHHWVHPFAPSDLKHTGVTR